MALERGFGLPYPSPSPSATTGDMFHLVQHASIGTMQSPFTHSISTPAPLGGTATESLASLSGQQDELHLAPLESHTGRSQGHAPQSSMFAFPQHQQPPQQPHASQQSHRVSDSGAVASHPSNSHPTSGIPHSSSPDSNSASSSIVAVQEPGVPTSKGLSLPAANDAHSSLPSVAVPHHAAEASSSTTAAAIAAASAAAAAEAVGAAEMQAELERLRQAKAENDGRLREQAAQVQQLQQTVEALLADKAVLEAQVKALTPPAARGTRSVRDLEDDLQRSELRLRKAERALEEERGSVSALRRQVDEMKAAAEGGNSATAMVEKMRLELQSEHGRMSEREAALAVARTTASSANETTAQLRQQLAILMDAGHRTVVEDQALHEQLQAERKETARLTAMVSRLMAAEEAGRVTVRAAEDRAQAAGAVCLDRQRQCEAAASTIGRLIEENIELTGKVNAQADALAAALRQVAQRDAGIQSLEAMLAQTRGSPASAHPSDFAAAAAAAGPHHSTPSRLGPPPQHAHSAPTMLPPFPASATSTTINRAPLERDPDLPGGLSDAEWKLVMLSEEVSRLEEQREGERRSVRRLERQALRTSDDGGGAYESDMEAVQPPRSSPGDGITTVTTSGGNGNPKQAGSESGAELTGPGAGRGQSQQQGQDKTSTGGAGPASAAGRGGEVAAAAPPPQRSESGGSPANQLHPDTQALISQLQIVPPSDARELEVRVLELAGRMQGLCDELEALRGRRVKLERVLNSSGDETHHHYPFNQTQQDPAGAEDAATAGLGAGSGGGAEASSSSHEASAMSGSGGGVDVQPAVRAAAAAVAAVAAASASEAGALLSTVRSEPLPAVATGAADEIAAHVPQSTAAAAAEEVDDAVQDVGSEDDAPAARVPSKRRRGWLWGWLVVV